MAYGIGVLLDLYMLSIAIVASWSTIAYSVKGKYPLKSKSYNILQWCALVGAILRLIIAIAGAALFLTYGAIVGIIVGLCYCVCRHSASQAISHTDHPRATGSTSST